MIHDALIVHWQNNTVTITASTQKAIEFFNQQGWRRLHEITNEWPDEFMPPLLEAGLIIAMKLENSDSVNYIAAIPTPDRIN